MTPYRNLLQRSALKFFAVCCGLWLVRLAEFHSSLTRSQFRHSLAIIPCRHLPKNFWGASHCKRFCGNHSRTSFFRAGKVPRCFVLQSKTAGGAKKKMEQNLHAGEILRSCEIATKPVFISGRFVYFWFMLTGKLPHDIIAKTKKDKPCISWRWLL